MNKTFAEIPDDGKNITIRDGKITGGTVEYIKLNESDVDKLWNSFKPQEYEQDIITLYEKQEKVSYDTEYATLKMYNQDMNSGKI